MVASFRIFSRSPQRNVWSLETQPFWAKYSKRNEKKNLLCFKIRSVYSVIFQAVPWFWLNNWRRVTLYYFIPRTLQRVLWHWKVSKQRKTLTTLCDFTIGNFGLPERICVKKMIQQKVTKKDKKKVLWPEQRVCKLQDSFTGGNPLKSLKWEVFFSVLLSKLTLTNPLFIFDLLHIFPWFEK